MIIVASPKKPFSYTAKNTARRLALINEYDAEIDALYAAVDESTQADLSPPSTWDLPSATTFVREVVNRVLKDSVGDNDDLFQKGCDRYVLPCIDRTFHSCPTKSASNLDP